MPCSDAGTGLLHGKVEGVGTGAQPRVSPQTLSPLPHVLPWGTGDPSNISSALPFPSHLPSAPVTPLSPTLLCHVTRTPLPATSFLLLGSH